MFEGVRKKKKSFFVCLFVFSFVSFWFCLACFCCLAFGFEGLGRLG